MRYSTLFGRAMHNTVANADAASHNLLERAGYIRQHAAGIYTYLHLGLRSLRRIEQIVREEMDRTGAQEILMSMVHDAAVWRTTGRYDSIDATLVRFADRHGRDLVLGMTHEEIVAELAAAELQSYRQLDAVVYQIQTKFRDEARPRAGLLRTREFLMKDAYSLHLTAEGLASTYQTQANAYHEIFHRVGLGDARMVESSTGDMGGLKAHEFIAFLDVGEDVIAICDRCGYAANVEVLAESTDRCTRCDAVLNRRTGVEIGNIFQLGTRYTDALGVRVTDDAGHRRSVLMGSYGIGVSRLLACLVERQHDDRGIALTAATAPYDAHVVALGRDRDRLGDVAMTFETVAESLGRSVLWDDRTDLAAGAMLADADLVGATVRVTLGRDTLADGTVELRERRTGRVHRVAAASAGSALDSLIGDLLRQERHTMA